MGTKITVKVIFYLWIGSLILLGVQVYNFLYLGFWQRISVLHPFKGFWDWTVNPKNWIGLHKILDSIPLFVAMMLLGFVLMFVLKIVEIEEWKKKNLR